ncbi:AAA family ATPase [Brevibacillus sp. FIR094]|uniref:AAA family ATPase n=1 Tax=Brevibacillus sp. FIR094 TaxID=3134809 RepID=UPI003D236990
MIKEVKITNLFGEKDNVKSISFDNQLTLLVGMNGSGKTTVLNIINAIITKSFMKLFDYDFETVALDSDEGKILVHKESDKILIGRLDIRNVLKHFPSLKISSEAIKKIIKNLENGNYDFITDISNKKIEDDFNELISRTVLVLNKKSAEKELERKIDLFFYEVSSLYFPTYRRLETDFLELLWEPLLKINRGLDHLPRHIVEDVLIARMGGSIIGISNKDIKTVVLKKWGEVTQIEKEKLNSLVKNFLFSLLDVPSIQRNVIALNEFDRQKFIIILEEVFQRTGLIDDTDRNSLKAISNYADNVSWAKDYLNGIPSEKRPTKQSRRQSEKMDIDSVDSVNKYIRITESLDRLNGFVQMYHDVTSEIDKFKAPFLNITQNLSRFIKKEIEIKDGQITFLKDEERLYYEDLSAGEKQLVALFVYTRLALTPGSIVIIDEPELSLHISWQRKFIRSLVSEQEGTQFIISTHSPFIISNYRDNVRELGPEDDE